MINLNFYGRLTIAGYHMPTKLSSLPSPAAQGEGRENKMEKFVGQDKGSLTEQKQMLETALILCERCSKAAKTLGCYQTL